MAPIRKLEPYINDVFYNQISKEEIDEENKEPLPEYSTADRTPSEITKKSIVNFLNEKIGKSLDELFKQLGTDSVKYSTTTIKDPIENYSFSSINFKELGYNKNVMFRYRYNNSSFIDILTKLYNLDNSQSISIYNDISRDIDIDTNLIKTALENSENNLFLTTNKENSAKISQFLYKLSAAISKNLNINIIFIYRSINISIPKNFILETDNIEKKTYVINVITPINTTNIHFEPMMHIDFNSSTVSLAIENNSYLNYLLSKANIQNVPVSKGSPRIAKLSPMKKPEIPIEIEFEPLDKEDELPIVEVEFEGYKRQYLMGRTGNLYEDDDRNNNLVGRIVYSVVGKSTIYWCRDYKL
jgi:hypothetical protein